MEYIETFSQQIDCGTQLIIVMSIILPAFVVFSLLICWIISSHPQQASSVIEFRIRQQLDFQNFSDK
ncbi:unnamed protein product [Rotaria magnacalcarata]|uniref:Uncharacterized protein n=1 Tax=Rotaria magnacalcarata TaxID=392030 RepID=A0A816KSR1_9BILA|nr:unnamed protein product [Rotaria magnacalcarata]CAF1209701.1 unnamed protein product [Rotaria magnacalcarata]CAF1919521.1 unnamed protein product [Rotaria magnacalcarata]CAF1931656.1 unnamed protein product [Rotaria magnacalcarata]CAF2033529.1 unnamed protein product [Rotaria magnacalcarata]